MPFQLRYTIKTPRFKYQSIGLSPDGQAIVGLVGNHRIETWEVCTGKLIQTLDLDPTVENVEISPDGQTAIVPCNDTVTIWDIPTQQILGQIQGGSYKFDDQSLSHDRNIIVGRGKYGLEGERVTLWDVPTRRELRSLEDGYVTCIAIDSTGQIVVAGRATYQGGEFQVWDRVSGEQLYNRSVFHYIPTAYNAYSDTDSDQPQGVEAIWLSPNAQVLLCKVRKERQIQIWDLQRGQRLESLPPGIPKVANYFGSRYATPQNGDLLATVNKSHQRFVTSQDGNLLATLSGNGSPVLINLNTNESCSPFAGHIAAINSLVLSPDGKTLITGSRTGSKGTAKIWHLASGELLHSLTSEINRPISSLVLTPAITGLNPTLFMITDEIEIWNLESRRRIQNLKHESLPFFGKCLAISSDGRWLASSGSYIYLGQHIYIWDWQQGTLLHSFQNDPRTDIGSDILNLVFSTRHNCLISINAGGSIKFWNWLTGELLTFPSLPDQLGHIMSPSVQMRDF